MKRVLNVGGNSKQIPLPAPYEGWEHVLLDIDPAGAPDVVCDARELKSMPPATYDSVYCSHNLEHYYHHDVARVLSGFLHVLKPDGFAFIRVPDLGAVIHAVIDNGLDLGDVLYESPAGPITVRDVIYGYGIEIERSGNDFFAHKTGFTQVSLRAAIEAAGFPVVYIGADNLEVSALAFPNAPTDEARALFNLT